MGYDAADPEWPEIQPGQYTCALKCLDIEDTLDTMAQLRVFTHAMHIYVQREEKRGGIWKEFDPEDKLMHLRDKLRRMEYSWEHFSDGATLDLDDAYDLLNYAAFYIRQVKQ